MTRATSSPHSCSMLPENLIESRYRSNEFVFELRPISGRFRPRFSGAVASLRPHRFREKENQSQQYNKTNCYKEPFIRVRVAISKCKSCTSAVSISLY
ncbi:hypothetical protein [Rhizobium leguminosarum]|uniref:hypothetical protein n=1 Tax=Rhizobium leguminosarum TaxID=384 RepID=UPI0013BA6C8A|nr:hypothetical protein [Rhizobium leguminosarum]